MQVSYKAFYDRADAKHNSLGKLMFYVQSGLPKLKAQKETGVLWFFKTPQLYRFLRLPSELIDDIMQGLNEGIPNALLQTIRQNLTKTLTKSGLKAL